jgi:hypothetical protein
MIEFDVECPHDMTRHEMFATAAALVRWWRRST